MMVGFLVYLYDQHIGFIERSGRGLRFTYAKTAVEDDTLPALSISLPKRLEPYRDRHAGPFFRNLLPEQAYRRLVASAAGMDGGDSLALLGAIGGECPGAVSIWPEDQGPPETPTYQPLEDSDLAGLFSAGRGRALGSAIVRGRLSLPGVQDKIALLRQADGRWAMPLHGAVTSHILKQSTTDFPHLLENELFCMALAERLGLAVPDTGLAAPTVRIFCAERFDRPVVGTAAQATRRKVHQEDFCQIRAVLPDRKYERDGGPGIPTCAEIIREHSALPAADLPNLLRWVGFNCLVGNEDGHAKNLAFLYTDRGLRLAPFYDLVSTEVYQSLERTLAMKVGRSWDIRNIQTGDWRYLAKRIDLSWDLTREVLLELSDAVQRQVAHVLEYCVSEYGPAEVYARIAELTSRHAGQIDRALMAS